MKRYAKYAALVLSVLLLASCGNSIRNMKVTDAALESLSPNGLRGLDAVVSVTAENPGRAFTLTDVSITAKYRKTNCLIFGCDSISVAGKCRDTYRVPVYGKLDPDFNLLTFMRLMSGDFDVNDIDLDFCGTVAIGRQRQKITLRDIPASKLLKKL